MRDLRTGLGFRIISALSKRIPPGHSARNWWAPVPRPIRPSHWRWELPDIDSQCIWRKRLLAQTPVQASADPDSWLTEASVSREFQRERGPNRDNRGRPDGSGCSVPAAGAWL